MHKHLECNVSNAVHVFRDYIGSYFISLFYNELVIQVNGGYLREQSTKRVHACPKKYLQLDIDN